MYRSGAGGLDRAVRRLPQSGKAGHCVVGNVLVLEA
jgi:hypothetical protein